MKKTTFLAVIAVAVIGFAFKAEALTYAKNVFASMVSESGREVLHPGAMVKSKYRFSSTDEAQVCTGKCMVFDIVRASGADGAYAIIYDSAPATAGTTTIFAKMEFDGTGIPRGLEVNPNAMPFVTTNGLAVDLSSVSGGEELLILYKDLD